MELETLFKEMQTADNRFVCQVEGILGKVLSSNDGVADGLPAFVHAKATWMPTKQALFEEVFAKKGRVEPNGEKICTRS